MEGRKEGGRGLCYSVLHRTHIQIPALNDPWTKEATRNNEKEPPYATSATVAPNLTQAICPKNAGTKVIVMKYSAMKYPAIAHLNDELVGTYSRYVSTLF